MFYHIVKALKQTQLTGGGVGGGVCNESECKYTVIRLDNDDIVTHIKALKQTKLTGGGVGGGVCNEYKYKEIQLDNDDVVTQHVTALKEINSRAHRRWGLQLHN